MVEASKLAKLEVAEVEHNGIVDRAKVVKLKFDVISLSKAIDSTSMIVYVGMLFNAHWFKAVGFKAAGGTQASYASGWCRT